MQKIRWSHPTWVRGLKLAHFGIKPKTDRVAPYVGAWIETDNHNENLSEVWVAPYVGAWIETGITKSDASVLRSHPTWVRGLKPS